VYHVPVALVSCIHAIHIAKIKSLGALLHVVNTLPQCCPIDPSRTYAEYSLSAKYLAALSLVQLWHTGHMHSVLNFTANVVHSAVLGPHYHMLRVGMERCGVAYVLCQYSVQCCCTEALRQ